MKNVLRICSYPTKEIPTMGLNSYMICGMDNFKTIFLAPFYSFNTMPLKKNTKLVLYPFLTTPSPIHKTKRFIHEFKRLYFVLLFSIMGIRLIHKHRIDIVHIHSPLYLLIALYGKMKGLPCFITYHGNEHKIIYRNRRVGKFFNKIFLHTFSLSIDIINYKKEFPEYSDNYLTINNAVDQNIYYNKGKKRKKRIIAVGRLEIQKGFKYLIDGFLEFHNQYPNYSLIIVGDGQLKDELYQQVMNLNLSDHVFFKGRLNQKQLVNEYNKSEIFIMTSLWEGFPKVLLEAIACGCKIITTRVDAIPIILGLDYNYFIATKSPRDISKVLQNIIGEDWLKLRVRYDQILSRYSWRRVKKNIEKEYLTLQ